MLFGGLSEQEVQLVSALLESEGLKFEINTDQGMINANKESMQYNLRHLNAPTISTHVLAISVEEDAFDKMSEGLKAKLLDLGITNQAPPDFDFDDEPFAENVKRELLVGNKKQVGMYAWHQLLMMIVISFFIIWYYLGR